MACLNVLKQDIEVIKSAFPETHSRFQTTSATSDELIFQFIDESNKKHQIHANIIGGYPTSSPVWYTSSDSTRVREAINQSFEASKPSNDIIIRLTALIKALCHLHSLPEPADIVKLTHATPSTSNADLNVLAPPENYQIGDAEEDKNENSVIHDDTLIEKDLVTKRKIDSKEESFSSKRRRGDSDSTISSEDGNMISFIPSENSESSDAQEITKVQIDESTTKLTQILESKLKNPVNNKKLIEHMIEVLKSNIYKRKAYTVELVDDNLYEWNLGIRLVGSDSQLNKDLERLKIESGQDCIMFRMNFTEKYPDEPPVIRLNGPLLESRILGEGGIVTLEILDDWGPYISVIKIISELIQHLRDSRIANYSILFLNNRKVDTKYENGVKIIDL